MDIIPAIDVRGSQCVRLFQGRYDRETVFGADPVAQARTWEAQGARLIHVVDLDGAREGRPVNLDTVRRMAAAVAVPLEVGGGVRSAETIADLLGAGVWRVVVGTKALRDPAWAREMARRYPKQVVLGLDARDGRVAAQGWTETSDVLALELAQHLDNAGFAAIVYTDISRDGAMQGPDVEGARRLAEQCGTPIIASGGIARLEDVQRLAVLPIAGMIIGRALYEGAIRLPLAIEAARGHREEERGHA
jgi:phosphoribosylformimino-5-aminoimidazole carboxamide ribotide isomerase